VKTPDTNNDGAIDLRDLNNVRNHFGATGAPVIGDTDGDLDVDIDDLNAVRNHFGETLARVTPEPGSGALAVLLVLCALATLRGRLQ